MLFFLFGEFMQQRKIILAFTYMHEAKIIIKKLIKSICHCGLPFSKKGLIFTY